MWKSKLREILNNEVDNQEDKINENIDEYDKNVDQYDKMYSEFIETMYEVEDINNQIRYAKNVAGVLRDNVLDPISLKILKSNKLYGILDIPLPSIEGFKGFSSKEESNKLARMLEIHANSMRQAACEGIIDKIKNMWNSFKNMFKGNAEKIEELRSKVVGIELDEEKCNSKTVKAFDYDVMKYFESLLVKLCKVKIPGSDAGDDEIEKFRSIIYDIGKEVEKDMSGYNENTNKFKEIKVSDIAKDITSKSDKYYKIVDNLAKMEDTLDKKVFDIQTYHQAGYINNTDSTTLMYIRWSMDYIRGMQKNYIRLATAVLSCKK